MAKDYQRSRNTALKLITKDGGHGELIKSGSTGGYNEYGDIEPDTPDIIINGVITPKLSYKSADIDGTTILKSDCYVFFHTDSATPIEVNMQTVLNGELFSVVHISTLESLNDIRVLTKLQLRS